MSFKNQAQQVQHQTKSRAGSAVSSDKASTGKEVKKLKILVVAKRKKYAKRKSAGVSTIQKNLSDTDVPHRKFTTNPPPYESIHFVKKVKDSIQLSFFRKRLTGAENSTNSSSPLLQLFGLGR